MTKKGISKMTIECHWCKHELHENNNAMTRAMGGNLPAKKGFGWITVIIPPFREVPCCDICFERPKEELGYILA